MTPPPPSLDVRVLGIDFLYSLSFILCFIFGSESDADMRSSFGGKRDRRTGKLYNRYATNRILNLRTLPASHGEFLDIDTQVSFSGPCKRASCRHNSTNSLTRVRPAQGVNS